MLASFHNHILIFFLIIFTSFQRSSFVFASEPKIVYMDGPWDICRDGVKRTADELTGLLISHPHYGTLPYNASRHCLLTIAVPFGYRIRLKALDFDVQGQWKRCKDEDSLLLFDHNQPLDPNSMERDGPIRIGGIHQGPGGGGGQQIFEETMGQWLGEFCGKMPNQKGKKPGIDDSYLLAESSHNALTISWHSKNEQKADGEHKKESRFLPLESSTRQSTQRVFAQGFRLLWSSFRHPMDANGHCWAANNGSGMSEFECSGSPNEESPANQQMPTECIPSALACNSYADCANGRDLEPKQQLQFLCPNIPNDPLSRLTSSGPKRLLLCAALVLLWISLCLGCCCCLMHNRRSTKKKQATRPHSHSQNGRQNGHSSGVVDNQQHRQNGQNERGPILAPQEHQYPSSLHHPFITIAGDADHHEFQQLPPPPLPPPSFSPPALPSQRPPPAPLNIATKHHQYPPQSHPPTFHQQPNIGHQKQRHHHHQSRHHPSASSSSQQSSQQSSSSQSKCQFVPPPPPPHHQQMLLANFDSSGGGTTTTGGGEPMMTTKQPNRNNGGGIGSSGEYFYVQQQQQQSTALGGGLAMDGGRRQQHLLL